MNKKISTIILTITLSALLLVTSGITAFADTDDTNKKTETVGAIGAISSQRTTDATETYDSPIPDYFGDDKYDTKGNLSLIREEKIIYDSEEMQFIAVTTKDGHVFYILIDYTAIKAAENGEDGADARQTVYFLNKVDDYDLFTLLYDDSDTDFNSMYYNQIGNESSSSDMSVESKYEETQANRSSGVPTWVVMLVAIALVGGVYWFVKIRPNQNKKKSDFDDDEDFDFDDVEINIDSENSSTQQAQSQNNDIFGSPDDEIDLE